MKYLIMVEQGNKGFRRYGETNAAIEHIRRQVEEEIFNCKQVIFIDKETGEVI